MKWIVNVLSHSIYRLRRCTVKVRAFHWTLRELWILFWMNFIHLSFDRKYSISLCTLLSSQCSILDVSFCSKVNGEWSQFNGIFACCSVLLPSRFLLPGISKVWCHPINCFDIFLSSCDVIKCVPVKSHLSNEIGVQQNTRASENGKRAHAMFRVWSSLFIYVFLNQNR